MRRRGFTLLEILVVIGLVAFVGLVSMQLFRATLKTWKNSADEQAVQSRFDLAIGQLCRDVWSATSIDAPNARSITIHNPAGTVHWTANEPAGLSRTADRPDDARHWPDLGKISFESRGPMLVVHLTPTHEEAGGEMVLMSQSMLLAGRPQ